MLSSHRTRAVLLALAVALVAVTSMRPAAAAGLGEERMTSVRATATGTVTAIDAASRMLTVRGPRGEFTYRADPKKVQALEAIKVGDTVRVDYVAGIGLTLRRGGGAPDAKVEIQPPGAGKRNTFVTPVLAVDRSKGTVRLQGLEGRAADFKVQDKADLVGVRVGDRVEGVVYELVAVGVAPAAR